MKTKHLMIPALLAALFASAPGFAQDRSYDHGDRSQDRGDRSYDHGERGQERGDRSYAHADRRYDRGDRGDHGSWGRNDRDGDRHDGYQSRGGGRYGDEGYGGERHWDGAGPNHSWHRGDRLPSRYRSNRYVVSNWRDHHLRPPPRGYHWVQSNGDYVLAAIATGLIADMIINSH